MRGEIWTEEDLDYVEAELATAVANGDHETADQRERLLRIMVEVYAAQLRGYFHRRASIKA